MIIAHLDMDAFFAAVEERENPQFTGLGIVVGADPKNGIGRGVVSTANYQARKYGIQSAMPISTAWRLSEDARKRGQPKTVFLPVNMDYYGRVSERIMEIVYKYVRLVEQASIDEAYLDLTFSLSAGPAARVSQTSLQNPLKNSGQEFFSVKASEATFGSPSLASPTYDDAVDVIKKIKEEIKSQEQLTATVGIGPNKLIAKMASASHKPNGLVIIKPDEVSNFLDPLPIGDIPGIGPKSEEFFHKKNIYKVSQLKLIAKDQLLNWMGKHGVDIYQKVRGIDLSPVTVGQEIKSISEQETFEADTISAAILIEKLYKLAERVVRRMKIDGIKGYRTVTIVVRFSDFTTKNRAHSLHDYVDDLKTLQKESLKLFLPFLDRRENPKLKLIRLIGVGIESFKGEKGEISKNEKEKFLEQTKLFNT